MFSTSSQQLGFGGNKPATNFGSNTFGSSLNKPTGTNMFGTTPAAASTNVFGNTPNFGGSTGGNTGFGQSSAFGGVKSSSGFPTSSTVTSNLSSLGGGGGGWPAGSTTPTNTGFGSTTSPFGVQKAANPSPFGVATTGATSFGTQPQATGGFGFGTTGSAFGQSQPQQQQTTTSAFGAPSTSAFGTQSANTFGTPSTGAFGATSSGAFGAPSTGAFGAPTAGAFGAPSTGAFGAPTAGAFGAPSAGGFGAPSTSTFGAPSTSAFGAPSSGGFGAPTTSAFGAPATSAFGTSTAGSSAFGAFGSSTTPQQAGGTGNPPFNPVIIKDTQQTSRGNQTVNMKLQAITGMTEYSSKSFEELRLEDYSRGNKGAQQSSSGFGSPLGTSTSGSIFGGGAGSPFGNKPATSAFGTQPASATTFGTAATTSAFGAPSTGAFGASSTGGFGAPSTSTFGAPSTSAFGAPSTSTFGAPSTSTFGAPSTSTFGAPSTSAFGALSAGGFGAPSTNTFGTPSTGAFGASSSGGFGAPSSAFGAPSTSAFGTPSSSAFGAPSTGAFGAPSTSTFGAPSTGAFGAPTAGAFGAPSAGAFGAPTAGAFGAPSAGGFGAPSTSTFGAPSTSTFGAPSTSAFGAPSSGVFGAPTAGGFGTPSVSGFGASLIGGFGTPSTGGFGASSSGGFGATSTRTFGTPSISNFGAAPSIGGFGAPSSGAFGAPSSGAFSSFSATSNQQQAQQQPQQQMQQLMQQMLALQQQQQQIEMASKIELLKSKTDKIVTETKTDNKGGESLNEQSFPNVFTGFIGGKTSFHKSSIQSNNINRSTARLVPRGVRGFGSPTLTIDPSASPKLSSTPFHSDSITSSKESTFSVGKNAKRLIISSLSTPLQDPTEDLPPVPSLLNQNKSPLDQKPHIIMSESLSNQADNEHLNISNEDNQKTKSGDATGLTPGGSISTPIYNGIKNLHSSSPYTSSALKDDSGIVAHLNFPMHNKSDDIKKIISERKSILKLENDKEENKSLAPILVRPGYYCSPDIAVLEKYSTNELEKVKDFSVFCPKIGKIEWPGETDLRGLNLDKIIKIDSTPSPAVYVYENVPAPEVGCELNKNAIVTLYNIFPKEGSSERKKLDFCHKLIDFCMLNDAEHIDYDRNSGTWIFGVKHFSRYGLPDDDSDDEDEKMIPNVPMDEMKSPSNDNTSTMTKQATVSLVPINTGDVSNIETHTLASPSQNIKRLRHLLITSNKNIVDTNMEVSLTTSEEHALPPSTRRRLDPLNNEQPTQAAPTVTALVIKKPTPCSLLSMEQILRIMNKSSQDIVSNKKVFHLPSESPCMQIMMNVKQRVANATGVPMPLSFDYTRASLHTSLVDNKTIIPSLQRGMRNYALTMSRSFRVGWTADGKIIHPGKLVFTSTEKTFGNTYRIAIEKVDPTRWLTSHEQNNKNNLNNIHKSSLEAILSTSHKSISSVQQGQNNNYHSNVLNELPLWCTPNASNPEILDQYVLFLKMLKNNIHVYQEIKLTHHHPDWLIEKALQLVDATFGQEKTTFSTDESIRALEIMPFAEDRTNIPCELWDRRRTVLSKWLESITSCKVEVVDNMSDQGKYGQQTETFMRLFDLLSCHRIDDAVLLAENAGMFRLATILSQLDGDASIPLLIRSQLEIWSISGANVTIPYELLKLYRLIGGLVVVEDPEPESSLLNLGWERALGMLFWYCSSSDSFNNSISTISAALDSYRIILQDSFVDPPAFPFRSNCNYSSLPSTSSSSSSIEQSINGLYSLLTLLFPSQTTMINPNSDIDHMDFELEIKTQLLSALQPSGYTKDSLDYRSSYLLLIMLECVGISDIQSIHAQVIRQHYIFQLLSLGLWHWAVFIALQIPDVNTRYCLVQDIILRFLPNEINNPNTFNFLLQDLNIPLRLLEEAKAYYYNSQSNHTKEVSCLISAGLYKSAIEQTVLYIAPVVMLGSRNASQQLLELLESMDIKNDSLYSDYWSDLSNIFLTYLRLKDSVESLNELNSPSNTINTLSLSIDINDIYNEAQILLKRVTTLVQQRRNNLQYNHRLILNIKENKQLEVIISDICTYLYNLVQSIDTLQITNNDNDSNISLITKRSELISKEYQNEIPLLNEKIVSSINIFNSNYMKDASQKLVTTANQYDFLQC